MYFSLAGIALMIAASPADKSAMELTSLNQEAKEIVIATRS